MQQRTATAHTLTFRPNFVAATSFAAIPGLTSAVLLWLGFVLRPEDLQATEGLHRILFTVIPMHLFSWGGSIIFAILACRLLLFARADAAVLTVSQSGLTLANGSTILWSDVGEITTRPDQRLQIAVRGSTRVGRTPHWPRLLKRFRPQRLEEHRVLFSSFELGADSARAAEQIAALRPANGQCAPTDVERPRDAHAPRSLDS